MTATPPRRRSGWVTFAGATFAVAAVVLVVWGLTALGDSDFLPDSGPLTSTVNFWGWIAILWGALLALAAWLVFSGSPSAKFVGVTLAGTGTVFWFVAVPKFPILSALAIVVNSLIIYGLVEHADSTRR